MVHETLPYFREGVVDAAVDETKWWCAAIVLGVI
jgi:hypothetical protein